MIKCLFLHSLNKKDMGNFLKSLFFGESEEAEDAKVKRDFDVLKYDGIRALNMGKTAYAIRCFNEALKLQEDIEILEKLVGAYSREDRMEEAIETAGRLIAVEPNNVAVLLMRANLCFVAEQYPESIADCHRAIALDATIPQAYFLLAKAQKSSGDALGAIVGLSQAIQLKDDFAEAHLLRAEVMLGAGDCKNGLEDAERVVKLLPEEENAYLVRGRLYEALENGDMAEKDYQYVTALNPFNEQAYLRLGSLYIGRQRLDEAIELFDEAIELKPDFARAYGERGRARLQKGDKEGSLADMKKALELNPNGEDAKKLNGTYSNFEEMYKNQII